jgi:fucose 4-O-acetylase-like acetyltransferase
MAILWFHTEMYYAGSDVTPYALYVGDVLATFFFLSGYLFLSGKPFSAHSKMMTIVRRLIIPYFFFTLPFVLPSRRQNSVFSFARAQATT